MTKEEKQLLYKDLSARQPYRPFVCFAGKLTMPFLDIIATIENNELMSINGLNPEEIKPYLRPMSSMTDEEKKEYHNLCYEEERERLEFGEWVTRVYYHNTIKSIDWLNAHHFDYRGLIPIGLALEAREDMY